MLFFSSGLVKALRSELARALLCRRLSRSAVSCDAYAFISERRQSLPQRNPPRTISRAINGSCRRNKRLFTRRRSLCQIIPLNAQPTRRLFASRLDLLRIGVTDGARSLQLTQQRFTHLQLLRKRLLGAVGGLTASNPCLRKLSKQSQQIVTADGVHVDHR